MKDYNVLGADEISAVAMIRKAFDKGYRQGYEDANNIKSQEIYNSLQREYERGRKDGYQARMETGCEYCKYQDKSTSDMPCRECKHNHTDKWEMAIPQDGMVSDKLTTDNGEPDGVGGQIFCP